MVRLVNSLSRVAAVLLFIFGYFSVAAYGEIIILKNGKEIEADIIEKTDDYIVVDFYGVDLTYYNEDIAQIKEDETMTEIVSDSPSSFKLIMKGEKKEPEPKEEAIEQEQVKVKEEKPKVKAEEPKENTEEPAFISITIKGKQQWSE